MSSPEPRRPVFAVLGAPGEGPPKLMDTVGGRGIIVDSGLPSLLFVLVYTFGGQNLTLSLGVAVAVGVVLGAWRLARRDPLQNVLAGLLGLAISAFVAVRTGKPEDVFLPGLLINLGYAVAYVVSIAVRWPLLGVFVGLATGQGMSWRKDPVLLRAFTVASWIWVVMFCVRLVVKVPLYLAGPDALFALGIVNVATGWPLFFLCLWLSYLVITRAQRRAHAA